MGGKRVSSAGQSATWNFIGTAKPFYPRRSPRRVRLERFAMVIETIPQTKSAEDWAQRIFRGRIGELIERGGLVNIFPSLGLDMPTITLCQIIYLASEQEVTIKVSRKSHRQGPQGSAAKALCCARGAYRKFCFVGARVPGLWARSLARHRLPGQHIQFHISSWLMPRCNGEKGILLSSARSGVGQTTACRASPRFIFYPPLSWMLGGGAWRVFWPMT